MKIGCHVSIAGGIEKSVIRAKKLGINTMQIFSKNSLTWKERIYTTAEVNNFQKNLIQANIHPVFVHASYLINLASPDETIYRKSIDAFFEEMKRTELLLANLYQPYLIVHPGSYLRNSVFSQVMPVTKIFCNITQSIHVFQDLTSRGNLSQL